MKNKTCKLSLRQFKQSFCRVLEKVHSCDYSNIKLMNNSKTLNGVKKNYFKIKLGKEFK